MARRKCNCFYDIYKIFCINSNNFIIKLNKDLYKFFCNK